MKTLKKLVSAVVFVLLFHPLFSQSLAINTDGTQPDPNAILDLKAANKGLLVPRMSSSARTSIPNTIGLLVYDTTTGSFWYNTGSVWQGLSIPAVPVLTGRNDSVGQLPGYNTALGLNALLIPGGGFNTAIGSYSMDNIHNYADSNTAIGSQTMTALAGPATHDNAAVGNYALHYNTTGAENVAMGSGALLFNLSGQDNTGLGYGAQYLSSNNSNTAVGGEAMLYDVSGTSVTAVGALAGPAPGAINLSNATAIGYSATVSASNKIRLGNGTVTVIEGQVPFTTPSDGRYKYHVKEDVKGLDFILHLRPVSYQLDAQLFDARLLDASLTAYHGIAVIRRSGFIAQEVYRAAKLCRYTFSGINRPANPQDHYSLSYASFVVPLVRALQQQQQLMKEQDRLLIAQDHQADELDRQLDALQSQLNTLLTQQANK